MPGPSDAHVLDIMYILGGLGERRTSAPAVRRLAAGVAPRTTPVDVTWAATASSRSLPDTSAKRTRVSTSRVGGCGCVSRHMTASPPMRVLSGTAASSTASRTAKTECTTDRPWSCRRSKVRTIARRVGATVTVAACPPTAGGRRRTVALHGRAQGSLRGHEEVDRCEVAEDDRRPPRCHSPRTAQSPAVRHRAPGVAQPPSAHPTRHRRSARCRRRVPGGRSSGATRSRRPHEVGGGDLSADRRGECRRARRGRDDRFDVGLHTQARSEEAHVPPAPLEPAPAHLLEDGPGRQRDRARHEDTDVPASSAPATILPTASGMGTPALATPRRSGRPSTSATRDQASVVASVAGTRRRCSAAASSSTASCSSDLATTCVHQCSLQRNTEQPACGTGRPVTGSRRAGSLRRSEAARRASWPAPRTRQHDGPGHSTRSDRRRTASPGTWRGHCAG